MIRCENITKEYISEKSKKFYALKNINIHIKKGEFVAITGKSGSGKSTLLNMMGLIDLETSGKIFIDKLDTSIYSEKEKACHRNENIGYIFQSFYLDPNYTVYKNVEMPLIIMGVPRKERRKLIMETLEKLDIQDKIKKYVNTLSGGEQQRVSIARALVNQPKILLADEPCGNLDSENTKIVMDILKEQNKEGKTVVLVTHSLEEAKYADRNIFMKDGSVINETSL